MYNLDMTKLSNFRVLVEQDEDGVFVASVPAIPGCRTQGNSYEKALKNAKNAIELCLEEAGENKIYRNQIVWPEESSSSKFLGIIDIPIRTTAFA